MNDLPNWLYFRGDEDGVTIVCTHQDHALGAAHGSDTIAYYHPDGVQNRYLASTSDINEFVRWAYEHAGIHTKTTGVNQAPAYKPSGQEKPVPSVDKIQEVLRNGMEGNRQPAAGPHEGRSEGLEQHSPRGREVPVQREEEQEPLEVSYRPVVDSQGRMLVRHRPCGTTHWVISEGHDGKTYLLNPLTRLAARCSLFDHICTRVVDVVVGETGNSQWAILFENEVR